MRQLFTRIGEVVRSIPFQLPEVFLLIICAMWLTSGVCSALVSGFNLWDSIEPFASQLLKDERGNLVQDVGKQALSFAGIGADADFTQGQGHVGARLTVDRLAVKMRDR